jgi:hypothetical protein
MTDRAEPAKSTHTLYGQPVDLGPHNCNWIAVPGLPLRIRFRDEIREMRERAPAIVQQKVLDKSPNVFSWGLKFDGTLDCPGIPSLGVPAPEPRFAREGLESSLEKCADAARAEVQAFLLDSVDQLKGFDDENVSWEGTEDDG